MVRSRHMAETDSPPAPAACSLVCASVICNLHKLFLLPEILFGRQRDVPVMVIFTSHFGVCYLPLALCGVFISDLTV